ncbi:hypothetical protein FF011L_05540 [Roseimaritima multifibrata]|uniref:Uncharacterized protein n=1 Tax=Roseimaritima multifibrata TaxID=1930274 RepID=A0A517MAA4_9BACT|nr:hypothetical protein FF011L_05540 [Roseimaritima multifibrata]
MSKRLFSLGKIVATPGALEFLERHLLASKSLEHFKRSALPK